MTKEPDKELIEQLMRSGCIEADAEQTVREISETEQFLHNQDHVTPSPQFMQGLEAQIREKLVGVPSTSYADELSMPKPAFGGRRHATQYPVWLKRVGAIAAAVAIVTLGIVAVALMKNYKTNPIPNLPPDPFIVQEQTPELWELELVEFEEPVLKVDDLVISEVLELWTEAQWDIENLFGKENDHETQITDYAGIRRIGHRYA